ncbi:MAG: hypothetical protein GY796_10320 [Chloroflexi bacterium]|nr:hypothetical protein [Chloroflexota bacterium]
MVSKKIGSGLLVLIGLLMVLSFASHFYISLQKAAAQRKLQKSYAQESFTPEELKEDLVYFQSLMERVHPNEIPSFPLGDLQPALTDLIDTIDQPLTHLEFYQIFAPVANLLNDEHVMVFPAEHDLMGRYEAGGRFFPFDVQFIGNNLYISQNLSDETKIQAGMEIISINNIPAEELRTTLMTYYSGTRDAQKTFYLQEHFREALFLIYGFGDNFELVVRDSATEATSSYVVSGKAFLSPEQEEFYYEVIAPDTILFTYNAFEDKNGAFKDFLKDMFKEAQKQNIQHLIIDIRSNQGGAAVYGDGIFAYLTAEPFIQFSLVEVTISEEVKASFIENAPPFIRWFPIQNFHPMLKPLWMGENGETASITIDPIAAGENKYHFAGDVYLLVGPGTMSSASLFAATMQKYSLGVLIGGDAGGYATPYGNVVDAHLPNTGLKVWMPTSVIYGNSTGLIVPDHVVTQTVPNLIEQRDTVLEFVQELVRSK